MRHVILYLTTGCLLMGCASVAPSLREQTRERTWSVSPPTESNERTPGNPGYVSPICVFGAEVSHNGHWRLLNGHDIVPLPDGSGSWASYIGRDCDQEVAPDRLTYTDCQARIMIFQTGANSPLETVRDLRYMAGDVDFLSELNVPEQGLAASFSYATGEMRGLVWGMLTEQGDPDSGIFIAGEWPSGPRENLMQMQFGEIARSVRLTERACGIIDADELEIIRQP